MTVEQPTQGERLARVEEALRGVQKTLDQLVDTLTRDRDNTVPRTEYEEYKKGVEARFVEHQRNAELKFKEIDSRRAPWWIIASLIITGAIAIFNLVIKVGGS